MHLQLHLLASDQTVNRSVRTHAEQLFGKLERYLPDGASRVDLRLERIPGQRRGRTHYVHVSVAVPKEPRTFHAEALGVDFRTALDKLYDRAERYLRRRHKKITRLKRDAERKEKVNNWLRQVLSAPQRLLGGLRRK